MHALFLVAVFLAELATLPAAHGIGRSGNGTVNSKTEGFEASAPEGFDLTRELPNERLRLLSPVPLMGSQGMQPLYLELSSAGFSLEKVVGLGRTELVAAMIGKGWQKVSHANPCVEAFFYPNGMAVAAFWGGGKGVVAVGPPSSLTRDAEMHLLDTLTLLPGACAW